MSTSRLRDPGFTIIEVLVVVAIIGLLSSVVLASMNSARQKARLAAAKKFDATVYRAIGDNIVADWNFSECTGSIASDTAAVAAATLVGSTAWSNDTPYSRGCSLSMAGTDYANSPDADARDIRSGSMTWSLWIKTTATSRQIFYRKSDGSNANGVIIELTDGGFPRCYMHTVTPAVGTISSVGVTDGNWHHLACSLDRATNTLRLFVDGAQAASGDAAPLGTVDLNATNISFIGYPSQGPIGLINGVRIFSAAYPGS